MYHNSKYIYFLILASLLPLPTKSMKIHEKQECLLLLHLESNLIIITFVCCCMLY